MALLPEEISEAQYRARYHDDALWGRVIEAIALAHGLGALPRTRIPYGSSIVYALGDELILKLGCPLWRDELELEVELGRCLASFDAGTLKLPRVQLIGELEGWPYMVMERVVGVPVCEVWEQVSARERLRIAQELGVFMAQLQRVSRNAAQPTLLAQGEQWRERAVSHAIKRVAAKPELGAWLEVIEPWLADWTPPAATHLIHADLTDDNVLLAQGAEGWHVSGVIDFGDAMLGSPLYDACVPAAFFFYGQAAQLEAMLGAAGASLSEGAWRDELTKCVVTHRYCDPSWLLEQLGLKKQERPHLRALIDALCGARSV